MPDDPKFDWGTQLQSVPSPQDAANAASEGKFDWGTQLEGIPSPGDHAGVTANSAVPQDNSALRVPKMFGHALATGTQNLIGLPGAVEQIGDKFLPAWMTKPVNKLGTSDDRPANQLFPTSEGMGKATGLGLEQHPELKPTTPFERYGTAAVEALPNAAAIAATGGGAIPAIATAETGAIAARGAADIWPESKWAPVVAGVVGSLGANWASNAAKGWMEGRAATKALSQSQTDLDSAVEAARTGRYEATTSAANIRSASRAQLDATKSLAKDSIEAAGTQATNNFESAAGVLGKSSTLQEAGTNLQDSAREWMTKTFPEKMLAVAKPLAEKVPEATPTELNNFSSALTSINKKAGSLQPLVDVLTKAVPRQLEKGLEAGEEASALIGANPTWGEARTLRSAIGDAMKDPELISKIGESNLQMLYRAVTQDLTKTAKANGAEDLWTAYNAESTRLHNFASNVLGKVVSATDKAQESIKPEDAAAAVLAGGKKGATDLAALRAEIPGAVDELGAAQLRLIKNSPTAWEKSLSPEARQILVPDVRLRSGLDDSLRGMTEAEKNAAKVMAQAQQEHAKVLEAAQADVRAGNFDRSSEVIRARKKLAEAAAAVAPTAKGVTLNDLKRTAVGALAGNALSATLGPIGPAAHAAMELGGALLPGALRYGKNLLTNPSTVMVPATGAVAGKNALALTPSN